MTDLARRRRAKEHLSARLHRQVRERGENESKESGKFEEGEDTTLELSAEEVGTWIADGVKAGMPFLSDELRFLRRLEEANEAVEEIHRRELPMDLDPHDLSQAGWGVIFPQGGYRRLGRHLAPLLDLRKEQAGKRARRFTLKKGESAASFLARHGETVGTIKPEKVPYYLLIVGGPDKIPFDFQYHLSLNHAVGRIDFTDPADFGRYVHNVCAAEEEEVLLPKRTVLFSVKNENDRANAILAQHLVAPLRRSLKGYLTDWRVDLLENQRTTTKAALTHLLAHNPPGLFIAASHGRSLPPMDRAQRARQGGLVCRLQGSKDESLFTAADLSPEAQLRGQIALLFACYSAGLPVLDSFPPRVKKDADEEAPRAAKSYPRVLTQEAFVARLPQEMLKRGALAVLGHVDRSWTLSFKWNEGLSTVASLEDAVKQLLKGERLGHALRPLYRRYAFLSANFAGLLNKARLGVEVDPFLLGVAWTAINDARNFIILGDPAVYLLGHRGEASHLVRLRPEVWAGAREQAERAGVVVEEWVHRKLREILP